MFRRRPPTLLTVLLVLALNAACASQTLRAAPDEPGANPQAKPMRTWTDRSGKYQVRAGGSGDVTQTHRLWTSQQGSNVSSPVYLDGHLYWMHEQLGIAYCAKAATGEIVSGERLDRAGQVYASALLADGRLYYVTRSGRTFVLAARPAFEQLAVNDLADKSAFNASPAVSGSRLLLRSDRYLYCIESR